LLAYELYLKNRENTAEAVKTVVPIKKMFVKVTDAITVQLDSKTLEHYGEILNPKGSNTYFQEALSMPSNSLASVGLKYRATGSNNNKPYIELDGTYEKDNDQLIIFINGKDAGKNKREYKYSYEFAKVNESISIPVDLLFLRLRGVHNSFIVMSANNQ
jgi:hypothetical protein